MTSPPISRADFTALVSDLHRFLYDSGATMNVGVSALIAALADVAIVLDDRQAAIDMLTRIHATLKEEVDRKWPIQ